MLLFSEILKDDTGGKESIQTTKEYRVKKNQTITFTAQLLKKPSLDKVYFMFI